MTTADIVRARLDHQRLSRPDLATPAEVARWFGAVQSQDLPASLYGIGLRMPTATEAGVEQAIAEKTVVRSWPMRGTIHVMPAEDARWMVDLLAPRQNARSAHIYRKAGLTADVLKGAGEVLASELKGGKQLIRQELYAALNAAGIDTNASAGEQRGMHLLRHWAQEGLTCITPRRGKQQTFALFAEWVPPGRDLSGDAALGELAHRYFQSHGPATVNDFAWWTGLTVTQAQRGLRQVEDAFTPVSESAAVYWSSPAKPRRASPARKAHLLPAFDEYTVAYADRSAAVDPSILRSVGYGIGANIVIDGRVVGLWKRVLKKDQVAISAELVASVDPAGRAAIARAADRYGAFLGLPAVVD